MRMATMKQNHSKQKITEHFALKLHKALEKVLKRIICILDRNKIGIARSGYKFFGNLSPS